MSYILFLKTLFYVSLIFAPNKLIFEIYIISKAHHRIVYKQMFEGAGVGGWKCHTIVLLANA